MAYEILNYEYGTLDLTPVVAHYFFLPGDSVATGVNLIVLGQSLFKGGGRQVYFQDGCH